MYLHTILFVCQPLFHRLSTFSQAYIQWAKHGETDFLRWLISWLWCVPVLKVSSTRFMFELGIQPNFRDASCIVLDERGMKKNSAWSWNTNKCWLQWRKTHLHQKMWEGQVRNSFLFEAHHETADVATKIVYHADWTEDYPYFPSWFHRQASSELPLHVFGWIYWQKFSFMIISVVFIFEAEDVDLIVHRGFMTADVATRPTLGWISRFVFLKQ